MPVNNDDPNLTELPKPNGGGWLMTVLLLLPVLIMAGKYPLFPTSAAFTSWFSLVDLPKHVQTHAEYMLFVPLSAVIVAFFRLTLGMPVLSLFRPILVAIAFRMMGFPTGLLFLASWWCRLCWSAIRTTCGGSIWLISRSSLWR